MKTFTTVEDAQKWFFTEIEELDFVDNFRFAFCDNMDEYEKLRNDGCCGFIDIEVLVGGRVYCMGCNYGH